MYVVLALYAGITDDNYVTEALSAKVVREPGSLKLKLTYMFMFVEWLIFCAIYRVDLVIQFPTKKCEIFERVLIRAYL